MEEDKEAIIQALIDSLTAIVRQGEEAEDATAIFLEGAPREMVLEALRGLTTAFPYDAILAMQHNSWVERSMVGSRVPIFQSGD